MTTGPYDSLDHGRTGADASLPPPVREATLGEQSTAGDAGSSVSDVAASPQAEIQASRIDSSRYRIEGELGSGGMGTVLLATDTRLDRKVALKRLKTGISRSQRAIERFQTEARSIAALDHSSIVRVYDYGFDDEGPLLVLEYVDGLSLAERIRQGPVDVQQAVTWTCTLCEALNAAHARQVIHRDVKPANILLTMTGVPKLTDFGLARRESQDASLTQSGVVLGTLDFMPPEQRRSASAVDARSDLWSLGATLYQLVTGRSPRVLRLDRVPATLQPVLGQVLEEEPRDRYQSALEFRAALHGAAEAQSRGGGWWNRVEGLSRNLLDAAAPKPVERRQRAEQPGQPAAKASPAPPTAPPAKTKKSPETGGSCPGCGKACTRNEETCAECGCSLNTVCLQCSKPLKVWQSRCPDCLGDQQKLRKQREEERARQREQLQVKQRKEAEARLLEAEALREEHRYSAAVVQARQVQFLAKQCEGIDTAAADRLIAEVSVIQLRMETEVTEMLERSRRQFDDRDFAGVLETLKSLATRPVDPDAQSSELAGCWHLWEAARESIDEADRLQAEIFRAMQQQEYVGLLEKMNRFLELRPGHSVIAGLRKQLETRELSRLRKSCRVQERLAKAWQHRRRGDFESVIELLDPIPATVRGESCLKLLEWAREAATDAEVRERSRQRQTESREVTVLVSVCLGSLFFLVVLVILISSR